LAVSGFNWTQEKIDAIEAVLKKHIFFPPGEPVVELRTSPEDWIHLQGEMGPSPLVERANTVYLSPASADIIIDLNESYWAGVPRHGHETITSALLERGLDVKLLMSDLDCIQPGKWDVGYRTSTLPAPEGPLHENHRKLRSVRFYLRLG